MAVSQSEKFTVRTNGFIPDEKTAVAVGVAIMTPIFGRKLLDNEGPFKATLAGDTWTVYGSLPKPRNSQEVVFGGTATIELSKKDGHVLQVWHSK
jgi:hypothetical protein